MIFRDDTHAEQWADAVERAGAHRDDDTVKGDFGATLYILTGVPGLYPRAKKYIEKGWIDFNPILNELGLSTGEKILAGLAGNLYNGGEWGGYTAHDLISHCDAETTELALKAVWLRKQRIDMNTIFD